MSQQYVVIGGNAAGMSTATRLRRLDETAEIVVLERGENISYASCGLPYHLSGTVAEDDLTVMGSEQLAAAFDLDIRTGVAATNVDPDTQTVSVTAASQRRLPTTTSLSRRERSRSSRPCSTCPNWNTVTLSGPSRTRRLSARG